MNLRFWRQVCLRLFCCTQELVVQQSNHGVLCVIDLLSPVNHFCGLLYSLLQVMVCHSQITGMLGSMLYKKERAPRLNLIVFYCSYWVIVASSLSSIMCMIFCGVCRGHEWRRNFLHYCHCLINAFWYGIGSWAFTGHWKVFDSEHPVDQGKDLLPLSWTTWICFGYEEAMFVFGESMWKTTNIMRLVVVFM